MHIKRDVRTPSATCLTGQSILETSKTREISNTGAPLVQAILAGNCVSTDKDFLRRHMPALHAFLHFRVVDVSSLHELMKRWKPGRRSMLPVKKCAHTAMSDLLESLEELRFYRKHVFDLPEKKRVQHWEHDPDDDVADEERAPSGEPAFVLMTAAHRLTP